LADVNAEIGVNIDTSSALAQLKSLQREIARFHSSVARSTDAAALAQRDLQKNFINGVNAIQGFSAELRTVRTTAENFSDSLERNKFSMREYFRYSAASTKTFGRFFRSELDTVNKVALENVKRLQTQYIKMGRDANGAMKAIAVMPTKLDLSNVSTQLQIAAQKQALFNQLVKQGSTNLLNFGKNTQWAGRQLMVGFTLPLIGLGTAATKAFMDMETAAIKFKKVYGDLFTAPEETQFALESIQALGKEFTKYGIAVSNTVALAAEAAAAGFSGSDLQAQVAQATRLQVLGQVDQQKALETTISLQNAFRISSVDLADAINFLNAVENQTVVSLEDITTAIPKAAPIVRELGGDIKDLAFFMAAMKEGGINASEGANALKSGLASLINPSDKARGMLNDMGIDIDNIVESNVGNLKATVVEFAEALDDLSDLQRQRAIEQLFGKFQQARLSALFDNVIRDGNQAARVLDLATASMEDLAALAEKELGLTADSAMNKFRASIESLKVSLVPIGQTFLEVITPLLDKLNGLLEWFNGLSDTSKKVITKVIFYIGGLGPVLLMTIGLMANFIANGIKGLMLLRNGFLRLTGQSKVLGEQTNFLSVEQQNAVAAAASLEQSHMKLQQAFTGEAAAVRSLIAEYQRMVTAQNAAATRFPGMMSPGFKVKGYEKGVVSVPGPKGAGDIVPSMLSPGEAVIPAKMAQKYAPLINAMISGNIPGFKNGLPSIYGGQERLLGPYTMLAPGNTPGGFGLSKEFLDTAGFAESLRNTAAVAGSIESNMRLTDKTILSMIQQAAPYTDEITDQLRIASREMAESGQQAKHISELFARKRQEISLILDRLSATGASGAGIASGMRKFAYATNADIMSGGNVRVPGVTIDPNTGEVVRSTHYSIRSGKASRFQVGVQRANRLAPISSTEKLTRAHVLPESRVLAGGIRRLGGAGMALPPQMRTAAEAEIQRRSALIGEKIALSAVAAAATGAGTASPSRKTIPIGEDIARGLQVGMMNQIDETRAVADRLSKTASTMKSPTTGKPITQRDIATNKKLTGPQIGKMASPLILPGVQPLPGGKIILPGQESKTSSGLILPGQQQKSSSGLILPGQTGTQKGLIIPGTPRTIPGPNVPLIIPSQRRTGAAPGGLIDPRTGTYFPKTVPDSQAPGKVLKDTQEGQKQKTKRFAKARGAVGKRVTSMRGNAMGAGMGVSALVFALSMLPGKIGQLANAIMPAVFALQAFAMLAGAIGGIGAAVVALGVGLFMLNQSAKKSADELKKAADLEVQARVGSAKSIQEYAEFTGRALPSAREFSRNNRQLISASGQAVERFADFYKQEGNTSTAIINEAAVRGTDVGMQAAAMDVAQRAAIFGLSPQDIAANIKAASDLIGADQVELRAKVQQILAPNGEDITKEPLTVEARMNFLQESSKQNIQAIQKDILELSKIKLPKLNINPLSGDMAVGGVGLFRRAIDTGKRMSRGESFSDAMTTMTFQELKQAAGYQQGINESYSGGFGSEVMGALKQGARNIMGYGYEIDTLKAYKDIQGSVSSATMQLSIAFTQQKESLALLNQQYADGLITREQYDAGLATSLSNFDLLTESSKSLINELNKIDPEGTLAADALKGMGEEAFSALKKTNPELFKRITKSMKELDGAAQIDIMMGYAKGSLTILDVARIPEVLKAIDGMTADAAINFILNSDLSQGAKGNMTAGQAQAELDRINKELEGAAYYGGERGALLRRKGEMELALANAKKMEKDALGVNQTGPLDTDTGKGANKAASGIDNLTKAYDKELERLKKKRDALKEVNDELNRQNQYQMKQMDLLNQAAKAKMTGDYLAAAALQQESMMEGAKFASESKVIQMDKLIGAVEDRKAKIEDSKTITTADKKFLGKIKSGNYQSIAPMPTTPAVGFAAKGIAQETATTQMAGGAVYNVTMNVSGGNPEEIATKVIAKIKTISSKNNKSNGVTSLGTPR
jgi:TP901 family phage tail tape measure protein